MNDFIFINYKYSASYTFQMFPKRLRKGHYSKTFLPVFFTFVNAVLVTPTEERFKQSHSLLFRWAKIVYVEYGEFLLAKFQYAMH